MLQSIINLWLYRAHAVEGKPAELIVP